MFNRQGAAARYAPREVQCAKDTKESEDPMISIGRIVLGVFLGITSISANAQGFPARPLKIMVGYAPGGGMDVLARIVTPKLTESLGQQVLVENRVGASGAVAADALIKSLADGYTIFMAESGTLVVPAINPSIGYDPVKSFAPISAVCSLPLAFVVNPAFPVKSMQELIALFKASPGKYSFATPGVAGINHLSFELFMRTAGVSAVHVPYKGASAMMPDIISGQVPVGVSSAAGAAGQVRAGKIRVIGITSLQRTSSAPDWPTVAETLPGFDASPRVFAVAPAGTPAAVIARWNEAFRFALGSKDVQDAYDKQGAVATPGTPEALAAQITAETKRWATVVQEAKIKAE